MSNNYITYEDDVKNIVAQILELQPEYWDNPNGGEEATCPFCRNKTYCHWSEDTSMEDINHDLGCAYLIAKDLNTK